MPPSPSLSEHFLNEYLLNTSAGETSRRIHTRKMFLPHLFQMPSAQRQENSHNGFSNCLAARLQNVIQVLWSLVPWFKMSECQIQEVKKSINQVRYYNNPFLTTCPEEVTSSHLATLTFRRLYKAGCKHYRSRRGNVVNLPGHTNTQETSHGRRHTLFVCTLNIYQNFGQ